MYTLVIFMIKTVHQRVDYACMSIDRDSQPSKSVEKFRSPTSPRSRGSGWV